jgi:acetoin utilization deacetylase AcuC-like enzyme
MNQNQEPGGVGLVYDARYKEHLTGAGHPERPARLDAIHRALQEAALLPKLVKIAPRRCPREQLLACHTERYLDTVERDIQHGAGQLSTGDTEVCPTSLEIAELAAGGVLAAVDAVCQGEVRRAFCAVRPPGHHATPDRGMGFCLFNNVAIGARYAQMQYGVARVLIADWDVHHGNGTQDIFYEDGSVFFFSTHQSPWYPGTGQAHETGRGAGLGSTLNQPLPAGSGRDEVVGAFTRYLVPAAAQFQPDLVLISAGFDSRRGDPLGQFLLQDEDFAELTGIMRGVASEYAQGRLISVLEGGYHLDGLGKAVAAHVTALL